MTFANRAVAFYSEAQISNMYKGQYRIFELRHHLFDKLGFVLHNIDACFHDGSGWALQLYECFLNN